MTDENHELPDILGKNLRTYGLPQTVIDWVLS